MNYSKITFKISCWAFILVGIGHTATDLLGSKSLEQLQLMHTMEAFKINLAGTETNVFSPHQGFSLMMGVLLLAFGLLNLQVLKNLKETKVPKNILSLNIGISLICTGLFVKYFPLFPLR